MSDSFKYSREYRKECINSLVKKGCPGWGGLKKKWNKCTSNASTVRSPGRGVKIKGGVNLSILYGTAPTV
jgi:hypothetical protein